jgi:hypothetical protein
MAAAVWDVMTDTVTRDALVVAGHRRVDDFSLERSGARLLDALAPVLARGAA